MPRGFVRPEFEAVDGEGVILYEVCLETVAIMLLGGYLSFLSLSPCLSPLLSMGKWLRVEDREESGVVAAASFRLGEELWELDGLGKRGRRVLRVEDRRLRILLTADYGLGKWVVGGRW